MAAEVPAHPAATVVLLRPGPAGLEVLLTQRPSTMAFAADMHVFPGGRVDPGDADPSLVARSAIAPAAAAAALGGDLEPVSAIATYHAAIRELFEEAGVLLAEGQASAAAIAAARSALLAGDVTFATLVARLDLRLRTDLLVPLSRWVTPPVMPRRFDARFFAARLPDGVEPTFEGGEVVAHAWLRPTDALAAMAKGSIAMFPPTSTTLQQLEYAPSILEIRERLAPVRLGPVVVEPLSPDVTRIVMPAGGGVAGQPVSAYLVGRRRHVLIDPGDPTGPALDRAIALAVARGGTIDAIALTHVDADHAGGAETLVARLGVPILTGPGGGAPLTQAVRELTDGELLDVCDVPLRTILAPGPRPDHAAFLVGDGVFVVSGDLEGVRGARSILGPADPVAWAVSLERIGRLAPNATRLAGHPTPSV